MSDKLKSLSQNDISMIVDQCFHAYSSSNRVEAVVMAQQLFDEIPEQIEPKHETVSDREERTGETYPDDAPVWVEYRILREDRTEWKLCIFRDIKCWDNIASKYNIETSEIAIVANHHGKPSPL